MVVVGVRVMVVVMVRLVIPAIIMLRDGAGEDGISGRGGDLTTKWWWCCDGGGGMSDASGGVAKLAWPTPRPRPARPLAVPY